MNSARPPSLIMDPMYTPQQRFQNGSDILIQTSSHSQESTQNDTFATPKLTATMANSEKRKQQTIEGILEFFTQKLGTLPQSDLAVIFTHLYNTRNESKHDFFKGIFGVIEEPIENTKVLTSAEIQEELKERIQRDPRYAFETHRFVLKCLIGDMAPPDISSTVEAIVKNSVSVGNKYFQTLADREDLMRKIGRPEGSYGTLLMNRVQPSIFHNGSNLAHQTLPERTFNATGIQFSGVSIPPIYDIQRGGCNEITSTIMSSPSATSDAGSERTIVQVNTRRTTQTSHTEQEEQEGLDSCKTKVTSSKIINDCRIDRNPINEEQMREDDNSSQESATADLVDSREILFNDIGRMRSANLVRSPTTVSRRDNGDFDGNQEGLTPTTKKPTRTSLTLDFTPDGGSATLRNSESEKSKNDQDSNELEIVRSISRNAAKDNRVLDNESTRVVSHENSYNFTEQHTERPQENSSIEMVEKAEEVRQFLNTDNSEKNDEEVDISAGNAVEAGNAASGSTDGSQEPIRQEDGRVQVETTTARRSNRTRQKPRRVGVELTDEEGEAQNTPTPIRKPTTRNGRRSRSTRSRKTATNVSLKEDENIVKEPVATTSQNQDNIDASSEAISKTSTSHSDSSDVPFVLNLNLYKSSTEDAGANSSASRASKPKRKRYPRKKETIPDSCMSEKRLRSEPISHEDSHQTATIVNQNSSDPFDPRNQIQLPTIQYQEPTHQVEFTDPAHLPGDPFFGGGLVQQNNNSLHYPIPQYNTDFSQPSYNPGFTFDFASNSEYRNNYQSQTDHYYTGNL
ncbi:unnamed protein product [Caenorhabditis brenneri]